MFAVLGETIPIITDEAAQSLEFPAETADYALPGSMELAENCIVKLRSGQKACLLKSHGAVCFGEDMEDAVKTAVVLETTEPSAVLVFFLLAPGLPIEDRKSVV